DVIDLGVGNTAAYRRAQSLAWSWLVQYQLETDRWSGFSPPSPWGAAAPPPSGRAGGKPPPGPTGRAVDASADFEGAKRGLSCCGRREQNTYWFSDGYADYLRSFNWAMVSRPELAPKGQNHLLGSTSVVRSVSYARNRVACTTFSPAAREVLRLRFRPTRVVG